MVQKIATFIERDQEELGRLESLNGEKTFAESREDMEAIADTFHYYADLAGKDLGKIIAAPIPNSISRIVCEPVGVCAQITPRNYPLLQAAWKLAAALVAGNTLVMKPSEITPLTTIRILELFEEAGIPAGVANLVLGSRTSVGAKLAVSEKIDLISFTGGLETDRKIMQAASNNMKKSSLNSIEVEV